MVTAAEERVLFLNVQVEKESIEEKRDGGSGSCENISFGNLLVSAQ